jgi:hypothetical protein
MDGSGVGVVSIPDFLGCCSPRCEEILPTAQIGNASALRQLRKDLPLGDAGSSTVDAASAVEFQIELALEGIVDRLDEPADGFEQVRRRGGDVPVDAAAGRPPGVRRWARGGVSIADS